MNLFEIFLISSLVVMMCSKIKTLSRFNSYVKGFLLGPLFLKTATLTNGKISVHLIGISHRARFDFYQKINKFLDKIPEHDSITLVEGVGECNCDLHHIQIPRRARGIPKKSKSERVDQDDYMDYHSNQINADIAISDLSESLQEWHALFKSNLYPEETGKVLEVLDVFRNARLVENLQDCIQCGKYANIIIPWGAAHMEFVDTWLRLNGFKVVFKKHFRAL